MSTAPDLLDEVRQYVQDNIGEFHKRRLASLQRLELKKLLERKNPYLFRAKNILTAGDLVRSLLDAHLSSQEEAIFGDFLEGLAVFVAGQVYGGHKSPTDGIDLEFVRDGVLYVVAVKSGPNWANSQQIKKLEGTFEAARRRLRTSRSTQKHQFVNGCCYGRCSSEERRGGYVKLCGEAFWELISGNDRLYVEIIEPLGHEAKRRNDDFAAAYATVINQFTAEFLQEFTTGGKIDWDKLVQLNSGRRDK